MKNIFIKTSLFIGILLLPAISSAYMLDPYPINANDNRTVYNASVTTSLALVGQNQNRSYTPSQTVTLPQQITVPAQATYTSNVLQPAVTYSNLSANSGTQTYAGVGNNTYTSNIQTQPNYIANSSAYGMSNQSSAASNSWTYNLPTQSLMPASALGTQFSLANPTLVAMDTNYQYSYANSLPSYYGAGATSGIYTVYGGQNYNPTSVYNRGLTLATGASNRQNFSGASSGDWVQTSGLANSNQYSNRGVSGHMPW